MKRTASTQSLPRRRGGLRQRLRSRELEENVASTSHLAMLLIQMFAWGEISAQVAQKIAHAGYKDACCMKNTESNLEDLLKISQVGSEGKYSNKCYGDFMNAIPFESKVPHPGISKLPFKSPLGELTQSFLWPHELFAIIWRWYPGAWSRSVFPGDDRLQSFWDQNMNHPAMEGCDLPTRDSFKRRCIPISIHGDDVPITGVGKSWCQQMTLWSWSSMTAFGATKGSQYFIYGMFQKLRAVNDDQNMDTTGRFFKMLAWSLNWLYLGQWPDRDWTGRVQLASTNNFEYFYRTLAQTHFFLCDKQNQE